VIEESKECLLKYSAVTTLVYTRQMGGFADDVQAAILLRHNSSKLLVVTNDSKHSSCSPIFHPLPLIVSNPFMPLSLINSWLTEIFCRESKVIKKQNYTSNHNIASSCGIHSYQNVQKYILQLIR